MVAAQTWTLWVQGKAFAANTVLAGVMNGGANTIKIRRVGLINNQAVAVTGQVCSGQLNFYVGAAAWAAPTAVAPIAHDSANGALDTVTTGHGGTPSGNATNIIRRYSWSSDEPKLTTATNNEWETLIPLNIIWDAGYGDANVQPLTLYSGESFMVYNIAGTAGLVDVWIEFTSEAP